jgi:hypothetical protein
MRIDFLAPRAQRWNFRTIYGGKEPSRNRFVSYRPIKATQAGGIDSLESIPGLLKSLKIPPQAS